MKSKRVNGIDLSSSAFAWVGDEQNTDTWLLPLWAGDAKKSQNLIKNHLARFAEMKAIPVSERARLWERLVGAAKAHGIVAAVEAPPPPPEVKTKPVKPKKDPMVEAVIAEADRRATALLKRLGYE